MNEWNAQDGFDNFFSWVQNHPGEVTSIAGFIQAGSTVAENGLAKWNAQSSITKSKVIAENVSTKLPASAKFLERASATLQWGGRVVGGVGIANTFVQWRRGNISDVRAIADGMAGFAGFFPLTAWYSIGYFGIMATYETYYNDGKPAF